MWSCACSNMGLLASRRAWPFAFPLPPRETSSVLCLHGSWRCHALAVRTHSFEPATSLLLRPPDCARFPRLRRPAHYTARSLRSGGISAAYAAGVPLERIMRVSNHASTAVVLRHDLDPLMPQTPAAWISLSVSCPRRMHSPCRLCRSRVLLAFLLWWPPCLPLQTCYALV
jgi:hypothetical protein